MTTSDINSECASIIHEAQEKLLAIFNKHTAEHDPPALVHSDIYAVLGYLDYLAAHPDASQEEIRSEFGEFTYNTLTQLRDKITPTWLSTEKHYSLPDPNPFKVPVSEREQPKQDPLARAIQIGHELIGLDEVFTQAATIYHRRRPFGMPFSDTPEYTVLNRRREELREELWRNL